MVRCYDRRVVGWQVAPTEVTPLGVWQMAYIMR
jgi:hypothetical protein